MNSRAIRSKMRAYKRQQAAAMLAGMDAALIQYAQTGILPVDPVARALVEVTDAAERAMDASIGGGPEHDRACQRFAEKFEQWQQALREAGS